MPPQKDVPSVRSDIRSPPTILNTRHTHPSCFIYLFLMERLHQMELQRVWCLKTPISNGDDALTAQPIFNTTQNGSLRPQSKIRKKRKASSLERKKSASFIKAAAINKTNETQLCFFPLHIFCFFSVQS